jgi:hypothetical protein
MFSLQIKCQKSTVTKMKLSIGHTYSVTGDTKLSLGMLMGSSHSVGSQLSNLIVPTGNVLEMCKLYVINLCHHLGNLSHPKGKGMCGNNGGSIQQPNGGSIQQPNHSSKNSVRKPHTIMLHDISSLNCSCNKTEPPTGG